MESRVIVKNSFYDTIRSLSSSNIVFPAIPEMGEEILDSMKLSGKIDQLEANLVQDLDIRNGMDFSKSGVIIAGYDESIQRYSALEGKAVLTSHAIVVPTMDDYAAMTYLTAYFYTKSEEVGRITGLTTVKDATRQPQVDKVMDQLELMKNVPEGSLLFIDGPLIAGDAYTYLISSQDQFKERNIFPVFFVKNSNSNLIVEYTDLTSNKFNSDMHWANTILKSGQRTSFFKYTDSINDRNAKIFCYVKHFNGRSPVRVEFFVDAFNENRSIVKDVMDLILYMLICQGNPNNSQIRPIAVAEQYARAVINMVDLKKVMHSSGLTSTMNEARGFEEGE